MDKKYIGKWRIIDMEQWDLDYIDLVVPGYFYLDKDHIGNFQFGTVEGEIEFVTPSLLATMASSGCVQRSACTPYFLGFSLCIIS